MKETPQDQPASPTTGEHLPTPDPTAAATAELRPAAPVDPHRPLAGEPPLAVDIDGTLISTDLFLECAKAYALADGPVAAAVNSVRMMGQLRHGRPHLKRWLAERLALDYGALPWQEHILEYLRAQHAGGRRLILATAADLLMAQKVALRLGIFEEVLASRPGLNLKSRHKAAALVERYGEGGFDYIGDAVPDLKVWAHARRALVVSGNPRLIAHVRELMGGAADRVQVFPSNMRWTAL